MQAFLNATSRLLQQASSASKTVIAELRNEIAALKSEVIELRTALGVKHKLLHFLFYILMPVVFFLS